MYEKMKLEQKLKELKEVVKKGEQNQAVINEIFEIELLLSNIYFIDEQ